MLGQVIGFLASLLLALIVQALFPGAVLQLIPAELTANSGGGGALPSSPAERSGTASEVGTGARSATAGGSTTADRFGATARFAGAAVGRFAATRSVRFGRCRP